MAPKPYPILSFAHVDTFSNLFIPLRVRHEKNRSSEAKLFSYSQRIAIYCMRNRTITTQRAEIRFCLREPTRALERKMQTHLRVNTKWSEGGSGTSHSTIIFAKTLTLLYDVETFASQNFIHRNIRTCLIFCVMLSC